MWFMETYACFEERTYIAQYSLSVRFDPKMVVVEISSAFNPLVGCRPVSGLLKQR